MTLKCGIVGLPNIGKSTFFNSLSEKSHAEVANYPFCTIDPNKTLVNVPDVRLEKIAKIANSQKIISACIEFVDIAGLIKGASEGEGQGNQFLHHISEVDLILHVVRCFEDENISHVNGKINPLNDVETIETELMLYDLEKLEKKQHNLQKKIKAGSKEAHKETKIIEELIKHLSEEKWINSYELQETHQDFIKQLFLLTSKPVIYVCNLSEKDVLSGNEYSNLVKERSLKQGYKCINICAKLEEELKIFDNPLERQEALKEIGIETSGIDNVINASYASLNLQSFFTAGEKETRMWTIKSGTTAKEAAACIHTDISKGFIKAEVVSYENYLSYKDECKNKGLIRLEGKEYIVRDGDILVFRFNKPK